ncbi:MAG: TrmH family RNA methyltransferase, partial [Marinirhabdus sp.]
MDVQLLNYLKTYLTERRTKLFQEVLAQRTRHITVVTEDVYQMHNTSAVMRSCDVFGIQDLHVVEARNGKRIDKEIAMGAQKWVNLYRYGSIESCMAKLKGDGYQIVATTPHAHDRTLERFEVGKKSAVFFGREDTGLSESVMNAADVTLKIPMYGFTESLNISVSAAIVL